MFLPLKWILIIPGTTSPTVHLVLIIPIVTAGTHIMEWEPWAEVRTRTGAGAGDIVAWGGGWEVAVFLREVGSLADSTLACAMDYFQNLWLVNMFMAFGVWGK